MEISRKRRWRILTICIVFFLTYTIGFMNDSGIVLGADEKLGYVKVETSLNIRTGPGTEYGKLTSNIGDPVSLENGHSVTIIGQENSTDGSIWYLIRFLHNGNEYTGYSHSAFIQIIQEEDFEEMLIRNGFPDSYKVELRKLHQLQPNWSFVGFQTGLEWSNVIKNEMYFSRNLLPKDNSYLNGKSIATPSSWKSIEEGTYNWVNNDWVVLSAPYWVQASEEIVKHFIDPRNFLNEENIFQLEMLTYDPTCHTEAGVEVILKNTFMSHATIDNTSSLTYAQVFIQIAKALNVSPYHLASRVRQEKGTGTKMQDGTYVSEDVLISGTVADYLGYYNYFNIQASGSTYEQIVTNGMIEAKNEGWNTRYKALADGSMKVAKRYLLRGQDTLYLQKFDVDSTYDGTYWHQYMQNIFAANNESTSTRNAYISMGALNESFVFRIPIYNNMPNSACARPTVDGNPNYKLKSLFIDGYNLSPTFNLDTDNYSVIVPYETTSVLINAVAYASSTSLIEGTGIRNLNVGDNAVPIKVTAENGTSMTYTITVHRRESEPNYLSSLTIDNYNISPNFDRYQYEYTSTVLYEAENIKINATPFFPSGAITGMGMISLNVGVNKIPITVTGGDGSVRTYTIEVIRNDSMKFDTGSYKEENGYIYGFTVGMSFNEAVKNMVVENCTVKQFDKNGTEKSGILCTGDIIRVYDPNGYQKNEYTVIIYGDVNGDGILDLFDYAYLKREVWGGNKLSGVYSIVGNVYEKSDGIDLFDLASFKRFLWQGTPIPQMR